VINSARPYHISEIFSLDLKVKYVVPKFQREYMWRRDQVDYLFNDLNENDKGYFLGTIICVNRGTDTLGITPLELIDGQQRLATISLLYAAIYSRLAEENRNDEDFIAEKNNLKYRLIQKGRDNEPKIELSYQNSNFADYKAILNELGLYSEPDFTKPPNLGNRRIYRIYQYFRDKLSELSYEEICLILEKSNSALVVKIEVESHADAFTLFESLNNRGIPLSAIDLIKNRLLSEIDKKKLGSVDEAFTKWTMLIKSLPDHSVQERFLRQYYNAFRYRRNVKVQAIPKATKSTLIKIYEHMINDNPMFVLDELVEKAQIYRWFVDPPENDDVVHRGLTDLLHIGAAPCYTFLLYLFSEYGKKPGVLQETISFLTKYFVRRNLTDYPPTRDLDGIFIELIDQCERQGQALSSEFIVDFLTHPERFTDIEKLKEKLSGDIYEENVAVTRFVLCKIEESHTTAERHLDLWQKDRSNRYVWTIEHILPEGENIPKEWVNMIADGDEEKARDRQTQWVHKLGNLTLTAYNPYLSNFSFKKKRDRTDSKGDPIGYKNKLYLNEDLASKDEWTIDDIRERTHRLVTEALKMFHIKGENIFL